MTDYEKNPLTMIYDALIDTLKTSDHIEKLVLEGNWITFKIKNPLKSAITPADTPEIMLVPTGGQFIPSNTSSTSELTRTYECFITAGDMRLQHVLAQVEWEFIRSMTRWKSVMTQLQSPFGAATNGAFVTRVQSTNSRCGFVANEDRQIQGWRSIWTVEIKAYFDTEKLMNYKKED